VQESITCAFAFGERSAAKQPRDAPYISSYRRRLARDIRCFAEGEEKCSETRDALRFASALHLRCKAKAKAKAKAKHETRRNSSLRRRRRDAASLAAQRFGARVRRETGLHRRCRAGLYPTTANSDTCAFLRRRCKQVLKQLRKSLQKISEATSLAPRDSALLSHVGRLALLSPCKSS